MAKLKITAELVIANALNNAPRPVKTVYHDKPELMEDLRKHGFTIIDVASVSKDKMIWALDHIYGELKTKADWKHYTFRPDEVKMAYDWIFAK